MRGFFGRNRSERPQPGLAITTYEEALYPPRAFRFHVQHQTLPPPPQQQQQCGPAPVVVPSIDADTMCEPQTRTVHAGPVGGSMTLRTDKRPPPSLQAYFRCYVPDADGPQQRGAATLEEASSGSEGFGYACMLARYAQFEGRAGGWVEPQNIFHYPQLLIPPPIQQQQQQQQHSCHVDQQQQDAVDALADVLGLPAELRTFAPPISDAATGRLRLPAPTSTRAPLERLTIRAAPRFRPARVVRRGAKVTVIAAARPAPGYGGVEAAPSPHAAAASSSSSGGADVARIKAAAAAAAAAAGRKPRIDAMLVLLNDDEDAPPTKRGKGEDGDKDKGGGGSGGGGGGEDGDDDAPPEDDEDDDEMSVDLYDAADDDDQADVDDMGGDDDGGDYF